MNTTEDQTLQFAKTCNEVAALLFPDCAKAGPAFVEYENPKLNECPYLQLLDLNNDFWALTLKYTVYLSNESQFLQYSLESGLYEPITESSLIGQIISNLNLCSPHFPSRLKYDSFLALKNRTRLKSVVERAKDLLNVDESYFEIRCGPSLRMAKD